MDKEQQAIARLIEASNASEKFYKKPLIITTSGGKDSSVLVELALKSGIDFELMHSHTTVDAPETVRFLRSEFKRLEGMGFPSEQIIVNRPTYKGKSCSMWSLIPQKLMPPTRLARYCCEVLKEGGGKGRYIATGVRWAESRKRAQDRGIYEVMEQRGLRRTILNNDNEDTRRLFETCSLQHKSVCNPIIDWTDDDVWDFIRSEKISINPLYECGYHRIGCIGCPMGGKRQREEQFGRWPGYKKLYIRAFGRMLEERKRREKETELWDTAEDVFHWWMEDGVLNGQIDLFGEE